MSRHTVKIAPWVILLTPWLLFYADYLVEGRIYVASTASALIPGMEAEPIRHSYQRDRALVLYPEWHHYHELQTSGSLSAWNARQFGGIPAATSGMHTDPLRYGTTAVAGGVLSADHTLMLSMMLRSLIALGALFFIFRHFGVSPIWSATAASFVWFSPPLLQLHLRTLSPLYLWFPAILANLKIWSAEACTSRVRAGAALATLIGLSIYTYNIQLAFLFCVVLTLVNALLYVRADTNDRRQAILVFLTAGLVAALIGTWRIVTFVDVLSLSYRNVLPKSAGGFSLFLPFQVFHFPHLFEVQNALDIFTQIRIHPLHPELKRVLAEFDGARLTVFLGSKTLGQIDADYRSILQYLLLPGLFLDRSTRRVTVPFWGAFLVVVTGYNLVALASPAVLPLLPTLLKSVNWSYAVVTAEHTCLALCFGFSLLGWKHLFSDLKASPGKGLWLRPSSMYVLSAAGLFILGILSLTFGSTVSDIFREDIHRVVGRMVTGQAPSFLSDLIRGGHPIDHYLRKSDSLLSVIPTVAVFFFCLVGPTLLLSLGVLRASSRSPELRVRLERAASIAAIAVLAYAATFLWLGSRIQAQIPYVAEKLRIGLANVGADSLMAANAVNELTQGLEGAYSPLPLDCLILIGTACLGVGLLFAAILRPRWSCHLLFSIALFLPIEGIYVIRSSLDTSGPASQSRPAWVSKLESLLGDDRYVVWDWTRQLASAPGLPERYDLSLAGLAEYRYGAVRPASDLLLGMPSLDGSSSVVPTDYRLFLFTEEGMGAEKFDWDSALGGLTEMGLDRPGGRAHDLLSMRFLVTDEEIRDHHFKPVYLGETNIHENSRAYPRAWMTRRSEVLSDRSQLLNRLFDPEFDPRETVLLEHPVVEPHEGAGRDRLTRSTAYRDRDRIRFKYEENRYPTDRRTGQPVPDTSTPGNIKLVRDQPGRLLYQVEASTDQIAVLSEVYYPGWQARLNGNPVDLYRADFALMAVPIKAGIHSLELVYSPTGHTVALYVTFSTFIATCLLLLFAALWDRKRFSFYRG